MMFFYFLFFYFFDDEDNLSETFFFRGYEISWCSKKLRKLRCVTHVFKKLSIT